MLEVALPSLRRPEIFWWDSRANSRSSFHAASSTFELILIAAILTCQDMSRSVPLQVLARWSSEFWPTRLAALALHPLLNPPRLRASPVHANISRRLIKSPKLYFFDVGLASCLPGIENKKQISAHPLMGALFENLVVIEALKHRYNRGLRSNLNFYRDSAGNEVDLVCSFADRQVGIEIKAGATVSSSFFDGLRRLSEALPEPLSSKMIVHGGDQEFNREGVVIANPRGFASRLFQVERSLQAVDT